MRRAVAVWWLAIFSIALTLPGMGQPDTPAPLPPCCRRAGKHHCAMGSGAPAAPTGPAYQRARCPRFPAANLIPANRMPSLLSRSSAAAPWVGGSPAHFQARSLASEPLGRSRHNRAPPALAS